MGADQDSCAVVFGQLAYVVNTVKFIGIFMRQSCGDGGLVNNGLAEHEVIAVGVEHAAQYPVFTVHTEIPVNRPGLFRGKAYIIEAYKREQAVGHVQPSMFDQEDKYYIAGYRAP